MTPSHSQLSNPSGTHLPILSKLLLQVNGPILELGCGYFSTPLLYWSAIAKNQPFRSYESDKSWAEFVGHPVQYVESWDQINLYEMRWAVAFIDHGQGILRKDHALALKDNADFIVLHDTEPKNNKHYRFDLIYDKFRYRYDFTKIVPNTTILSDTIDLSFLKD